MRVCVTYLEVRACVARCPKKKGEFTCWITDVVRQPRPPRPPRQVLVTRILFLSKKAVDSATCAAAPVCYRKMLTHVGPTQELVTSQGIDAVGSMSHAITLPCLLLESLGAAARCKAIMRACSSIVSQYSCPICYLLHVHCGIRMTGAN